MKSSKDKLQFDMADPVDVTCGDVCCYYLTLVTHISSFLIVFYLETCFVAFEIEWSLALSPRKKNESKDHHSSSELFVK